MTKAAVAASPTADPQEKNITRVASDFRESESLFILSYYCCVQQDLIYIWASTHSASITGNFLAYWTNTKMKNRRQGRRMTSQHTAEPWRVNIEPCRIDKHFRFECKQPNDVYGIVYRHLGSCSSSCKKTWFMHYSLSLCHTNKQEPFAHTHTHSLSFSVSHVTCAVRKKRTWVFESKAILSFSWNGAYRRNDSRALGTHKSMPTHDRNGRKTLKKLCINYFVEWICIHYINNNNNKNNFTEWQQRAKL